MVNSKIIRAGGLLVLAGCYVLVERTFNKNVVGDAKQTHVALVGSGRGSLWNTCDGSPTNTLAKLTSTNLDNKSRQSDQKWSFFDIDNPREYLTGGSDAHLVEKGPYNLRKYSVAYDVVQAPSSLTDAGTPDAKGALEYSQANAYLVLDQDVTATSSLKRDADLSLSEGDKATLATAKRSLASHLSMSDSIVNFSPDYLSLLGAMNDEVTLILSMQCTSDQIANIGDATKGQCSAGEMGDVAATGCACCMTNNDYVLATSRNTGTPPPYTNCNSFFDDEGPILSKLSLLASHDGGVAVKSAGEKKYDGSGDDFAKTLDGQTEIHTALLQSHTVNDLMFGYPSAYLGTAAFRAQIEQARRALPSTLSDTDLAKQMLTGQVDADLKFRLGDMAAYTAKVGSVCFASCLADGDCSGNAPGRKETSDPDKIKLGGIDCMPYTSAFETVAKCTEISAALQLDPDAPGQEPCVCANGSDDWLSQGCCLAGGVHDGNDLSGEGCLFEVAGVVDPNYAGMDTTVANAIDLGSALQSWMDKVPAKPARSFMCPADGTSIDEHELFGQYETIDGAAEHVTYYHQADSSRFRQNDVEDGTEHKTPVSGVNGMYFAPKGLTVKNGVSQISDAIPRNAPHPVYLPDAKRSIDFVFEGVRANVQRNYICGSEACIVSARLTPNITVFAADPSDATSGAGLPYSGVQPVGHVKGPSRTGRPEYLSHPLFVDGDSALYTQRNNSHVELPAEGNGIKIYRPANAGDPGAFDAASANYQQVDKDYVDSRKTGLLSHIDFEVATGLGARQRMKLGTSHALWECDPNTNDHCNLAANFQGEHSCYSETGSAIFDAKATADKDNLATLGRNNITYPCSAANLLTPKVVGGKILPFYTFEDSTIHMHRDEVDLLADYASTYARTGNVFITAVVLGCIFTIIGFSMLLLCLCFEQSHTFLEGASEAEKKPLTSAGEVA